MNLILIGIALITFLEINYPDKQESKGFCDSQGCYRLYFDEFGNLTNESVENLWSE
jgi:hypothetical protein